MLVAVIADTHLPSRAADLPPGAWAVIERADVVVHAGDLTDPGLLERLSAGRRAIVVRGNNDHGLEFLPEQCETTLEGVPVAVIHDAGPADGRRSRMRRMFPAARVVVFGHSHLPLIDDDGSLMLVNPGSPTDRRRMPSFTMAVLLLDAGSVRDARIVDLGLERAPRSVS